eukprot:CAMPEP_0118924660 /NCGR_PEP_ID=MMETSP1169-20130426/2694_1 /TAXON_ID=36882 /ORGANISM="Pyramimonas obovata, Strain CCMP722" /LENGTH=628 /DNA_ID=CAMNT_0006865791 /DNA_START=52 /DNA_END=1938 /DNA_ORIENTATION=+
MAAFSQLTFTSSIAQRHAAIARGSGNSDLSRSVPATKVATAAGARRQRVTMTATTPGQRSESGNNDLNKVLPLQTELTYLTGSQAKANEGKKLSSDVREDARNGWLSSDLKARKSLKERKMRQRKTKVVCTIGPASSSREALFRLCDAGMNVARLNMSHGDHQSHKQVVDLIKEYNATGRRPDKIALLLDTKGPEVRSGDLATTVYLETGDAFTFTIDPSHKSESDQKMTTVNYDGFVNDVHVDDVLLVDGGLLSMQIVEITETEVRCVVLEGGEFKSRRHLNVQGRTANLPSLTQKDWEDLQFGVDQGVDFFAMSFVHDAKVINEVKAWLRSQGAEISVLPKIESANSVMNLDDILQASDGAMVARGDLGAELPVEEVPLIQSEIVYKCNQMGKPVIVATNMLESMIENAIPTRAEVADITVAVREGTDAVMLSGETANGKYPEKAVTVMSETAQRVPWELAPAPVTDFTISQTAMTLHGNMRQVPDLALSDTPRDRELISHLIAYNTTNMANAVQVPIIVFTKTGSMAALLGHFRPRCMVYAFTNSEKVLRRMALYRGVIALPIEFQETMEQTQDDAIRTLLQHKYIDMGMTVCVIDAGKRSIWRKASVQGVRFIDVVDTGDDVLQ